MTTAATIVDRALISLGVNNELNAPDEYLERQFFDLLIDMINRWASIDIQLGITIPTAPADELGNSVDVVECLYTSLAIEGQDIVKVSASPALRKRQKIAYRSMKAAFGILPEQSMPASLPYGQGVNLGPRTKRFFPKPTIVGSNNTGLGG